MYNSSDSQQELLKSALSPIEFRSSLEREGLSVAKKEQYQLSVGGYLKYDQIRF